MYKLSVVTLLYKYPLEQANNLCRELMNTKWKELIQQKIRWTADVSNWTLKCLLVVSLMLSWNKFCFTRPTQRLFMNRILKHKLIYYALNYKAVDNGEITLFDVLGYY